VRDDIPVLLLDEARQPATDQPITEPPGTGNGA